MTGSIPISTWLDKIAKINNYKEMRKEIIDMSNILKKTSETIPKVKK